MRNKVLGVFTALVMFASIALGTYIFLSSRPSSSVGSGDGFDLSAVAAPKPLPVAAAPAQIQASPHPMIGLEPEPVVVAPSAASGGPRGPGAPSAASSSSPGGGESAPPGQREREQAFLKAHGKELAAYHAKLNDVAMKYYKTHPVVRDVDRAFANMSRYMAVKRQYDKDGNPFNFARGAIALPEVRAEIARRAADPAVWSAALGMINAALKNPPPPALYAEARNFMTGDQKMAGYVSEFTGVVTNNVPALVKGIPPGADLSAIEKVARDVSPNAPLPPSIPRR